MFTRLRNRLTIVFVLLATAPLVAVAAILALSTYNHLVSDAIQDQHTKTDRYRIAIQDIITQHVDDLALTDKVYGFEQQSIQKQQDLMSSLLAQRKSYEQIIVMDPSGAERFRVSRFDVTSDMMTNRSVINLFQNVVSTQKIRFSEVYFSEQTGEPMLTIGMPFFDLRSGEISSVVLADFRFKFVWELVALLSLDDVGGIDVFVTAPSGLVVAHKNPSIALKSTVFEIPEADGEAAGLEGESAIVTTQVFNLENMQFVFVAQEPLSTALQPAYTMLGSVVLVTAVVLIVSIGLVALVVRQIVSPIEQLTKTARAIQAGNLNARATIGRRDEIGVLAESFNAMTSQLQQTFTELEQSEARLRLVVENMPVMMDAFDAVTNIIVWNRECEQVTGYTAAEMTGNPRAMEILYPDTDYREQITAELAELDLDFRDKEYTLTCKDGTKKTISWSNISDRCPIPGWYSWAIGVDVTERNRVEEEKMLLMAQIQEQAQHMQLVIDTVPEGVFLLDASKRIVLANPTAERDLALLAGAKVGEGLTHLGARPLNELLTSPPKGLWHEIEINGATARSFEVIARPIEIGPTQGGWVVVIRDVTREREIQRHIQQQSRLAAVGQLAAGIAHDFNNIMAVITLYAQIVQKTAGLPLKTQQRLKTITEQAHRATNLIEQILDFSRRSIMERQALDLTPFVKEQVKLLERTLPEYIHIQLTYDTEAYAVHADPTRIQQVIMNLAVNARDAMPEGGEFRIAIKRIRVEEEAGPLPDMPPGDWIRLAVSDTGTGIPPDVLPHIFEPFFTTKAPKGTGLGLAQVYGIVRQHDGYIDVDTQVGKGTAFILYLPALPLSATDAQSLQSQSLIEGEGQTILIVEDDAETREALVDSFELLGYQTLAAEDGQKALAVWEQYNDEIALVLSDVVMPEMGGVALFHALRKRDASIKMALLTGHLLEDQLGSQLEQLKAQGLAGWLQKPPDLERLARFIARALGKDD